MEALGAHPGQRAVFGGDGLTANMATNPGTKKDSPGSIGPGAVPEAAARAHRHPELFGDLADHRVTLSFAWLYFSSRKLP